MDLNNRLGDFNSRLCDLNNRLGELNEGYSSLHDEILSAACPVFGLKAHYVTAQAEGLGKLSRETRQGLQGRPKPQPHHESRPFRAVKWVAALPRPSAWAVT